MKAVSLKDAYIIRSPIVLVKNAVDKEIIHKDRYDSYIAMLEELIQIKPYN